MIISISHALLYVALAIIMGIVVLNIIPAELRPKLSIPPRLLFVSLAGVVIFSTVPIVLKAIHIASMFEAPFFKTLGTILISFRMGQGGVAVFVLALMTALFHWLGESHKWSRFMAVVSAGGMAFAVGYTSHAASLQPLSGFLADSFHFLSAVLWSGVLLVAGFFATSKEGWLPFFRWFTPLAIGAVGVIILSGLVLMDQIVPQYVSAWMLTYGQLLLIKHLLFIPLVFYGFAHGFLVKRRLQWDTFFSPQTSIKVESILLLLIFAITAFMKEETPPHEVARTLQFEDPAAIAVLMIGERLSPGSAVAWTGGGAAILLLVLAIIFLAIMLYVVKEQRKVVSAVPVALLAFLLTAYFGLMSGAQTTETGEQWAYVQDLREGIAIGMNKEDELNLLLEEPYGETMTAAVYTVNGKELVAELFLQAEDGKGYYKIPDAKLTIGGLPVTETEHKIRTFLVQDGLWKKPGFNYTYVTIGYIQEPAETEVVKVHYQEELHEVKVRNNAFFTAAHSQNLWSELHPFEFFDGDGNLVGSYLRAMMELGAFCH